MIQLDLLLSGERNTGTPRSDAIHVFDGAGFEGVDARQQARA
jgi:hypothetical protein